AHEINNPLAGVLGNVQNIKRRAFTSHPANLKAAEECGVSLDKIQQYLEKRKIPSLVNSIYESGERAATIVRNMLGFSRKSSHRYTYESFPDLLEESIELVANDFNPNSDYDFKKIKIERHFAKDLQDVYCERNEIQQVLVNLLKNSADAMSERKSETETPSLTLRLSQDETTCTIEIEDKGPGMDRETRDRIFEPFYTTKSPGKGTGLGLYVSYTIIKEQHGGSIEVTESAKSGTRFIIKLPLQGHSAK
ncbi:MAG TPA: PAS domain-containing sensor histidine kinase, partial [Desulfovibrio sp.]|nr:PAS domain-containing sensor histidine kinase [Desulfovibrio sp.]